MKATPKQPSGAKKPRHVQKPTVMTGWEDYMGNPIPALLVLPMSSKRAALAKKKWEATGREQKVEAIAKAMRNANPFASFSQVTWSKLDAANRGAYTQQASAVLEMQEGNT